MMMVHMCQCATAACVRPPAFGSYGNDSVWPGSDSHAILCVCVCGCALDLGIARLCVRTASFE